MKRIERQMREIGFSDKMKKVDVETFFDICRNLDRGEWDNRLGEKPQMWDTLPQYAGFLCRVFGRLSKRDIQFYVLPCVPFVREQESSNEGNNK